MDMLSLVLIAAGLSMDAFAVSVCKGLAAPSYKLRYSLCCGIWFGGFQALMPAAGYLLGVSFRQYITAFDHWIAFLLLGLIGFNMVKEALERDTVTGDCSFKAGKMLLLAAATGIDALAVGITFAFLSVRIVTAALIIGVITFLVSAAGVKIGSVFGRKYRSGAELAGGIILIILGIKILMEHILK